MNWIIIPVYLVWSPHSDDVDYEAMGLPEPDPKEELVEVMINLDHIERINRAPEGSYYNCVIWPANGESGYKCSLTVDEVRKIKPGW